jgi:hypothetical protein
MTTGLIPDNLLHFPGLNSLFRNRRRNCESSKSGATESG